MTTSRPTPRRAHDTPTGFGPLFDVRALTVIVPAHNDAASIADTVRSLQAQTVRPAEIIVVDDGSDDGTGDIARALGVTVLRPPRGTGSRALARNFALPHVRTPLCMALDADATLAPDAIERLLPPLADPTVAAACGFAVPRHVRTVWERGRYVEYLVASTFHEQARDYRGKPLMASGGFSAYRTSLLRKQGGWPTRTLDEDMDLTWRFFQAGHRVKFVPEAVCHPVAPSSYALMHGQLERCSHAFVQNVRLHWRGLPGVPFLRSAVAVAFWDATLASALLLVALPVAAIAFDAPWLLLACVIVASALAVPVLASAARRGELGRALTSLPSYFLLRAVCSLVVLRAVWSECVLGRSPRATSADADDRLTWQSRPGTAAGTNEAWCEAGVSVGGGVVIR